MGSHPQSRGPRNARSATGAAGETKKAGFILRVVNALHSNGSDPLHRKAQEVARAVLPRGGRALLVGGFVRDRLLGFDPKDADLEVYGLQPEQLRAILDTLGRVDCVGESFRVYKLVWHHHNWNHHKERFELDVSLPRRDKKVGAGHKGFEVEGDPYASVEEAARRRDFTVNAILQDPLSGEILDPFGGRRDLESKILRAVDARHFGEDSLRVLRAMQFAARFGLEVETQTVAICRATPLADLPPERVWGEWEKWLLKAPTPSLGLRAGRQIGVFERLFPFLETALARRGADLESALDRAVAQRAAFDFPEQVALMLAVIGSHLGWDDTKALLDALNIHKMRGAKSAVDVNRLTLQLVGVRKTPLEWFNRREQVQDKEFRYLSARVSPRLTLALAHARGFDEAATWFEANLRRLDVLEGPPPPLLQGRHLLDMGLKPGPLMGEIIDAVYLAQLTGSVTSLGAAQEAARRHMEAAREQTRHEAGS